MVIVRSGVGVNYREPPDEIGRVGISGLIVAEKFREYTSILSNFTFCLICCGHGLHYTKLTCMIILTHVQMIQWMLANLSLSGFCETMPWCPSSQGHSQIFTLSYAVTIV